MLFFLATAKSGHPETRWDRRLNPAGMQFAFIPCKKKYTVRRSLKNTGADARQKQ
jgi:hypothetical protein